MLDVTGSSVDQRLILNEQKCIKLTERYSETGSGLRKDFTGYQIYAFGAQSTWAMERAITYAVMEILKDPDILSYLK